GHLMNEARQFLRWLFAPYDDPALRCELRAFRPRAPGVPPERRDWWPLNLVGVEAAAKTALLWGQRRELYFGVLPRTGRQGRAQDIFQAGWLWADIDGGEEGAIGSRRLLDAAGLPEPHLIVLSGGGLHIYWRLETPIIFETGEDRDRHKQLLQRLVSRIGG